MAAIGNRYESQVTPCGGFEIRSATDLLAHRFCSFDCLGGISRSYRYCVFTSMKPICKCQTKLNCTTKYSNSHLRGLITRINLSEKLARASPYYSPFPPTEIRE